MNELDYKATAGLWEDMFKDDSFQLVTAAVKALIATDSKGYPPHIGAVKESISKLVRGVQLTEMEAWVLVKKAISAYATREDFEKLPPAVQRAVGGSSQLVIWALTDASSLPVIMSNFMRSYRTAADAESEIAKLPGDVKAIMGSIGSMELEEGKSPAPLMIGEKEE